MPFINIFLALLGKEELCWIFLPGTLAGGLTNPSNMISCKFENGNKANLRHVTVDALVVRDGKILLVKRASHLINPNKYAIPGGYLNRDETTSAGALRELLEETGYSGKVISLFKITDKPNRKGEDRQNVNFTYLIRITKKVSSPDSEVESVQWFELNKIPDEREFAFDHYETVELYVRYLEDKLSLPIYA